ncbi:hypothetical protein B0J17DRAFT_675590 [Rhizoctonia solani]|nr:hypothetical protein B0J17DRAFT_675590 [Rhizoctonia solani]
MDNPKLEESARSPNMTDSPAFPVVYPSTMLMLNSRLPISRLPVEILLNIFFKTLPNHTEVTENPSYSILQVISICSVCSYWRKITLDHPSFWSHVVLDDRKKAPCDIASLCLERSQGNLVDVSVQLHDSRNLDPTIPFSTVQNFRSLSISVTSLVRMESELKWSVGGSIVAKGVPGSLRHLAIAYELDGYSSHSAPSFHSWRLTHDPLWDARYIQAIFEQLHTLKISGIKCIPPSCSYHNLQMLELGKPCSIEAFSMVQPTACNLVTLKLGLSSSSFERYEVKNPKPALPASLKKVYISASLIIFCTFLDSFSLGDHEIELESKLATFHQPHPAQLHSMRAVSTLIITSLGTLTEEHLHATLRFLPGVHTLVLRNLRLNRPRLFAMTAQSATLETPTLPFPRIVCLELHGCCIENGRAFKALVNDHPISRLRVSHCLVKWGESGVMLGFSSSSAYKWLSGISPGMSLTVNE